MPSNMSLFSVNAILILTTDDRTRLLTKYYSAPHQPTPSSTTTTHASSHLPPPPGSNPYPTVKEQKAFEKGLLEKTNKTTGDVILYDNRVVVFKMDGDVMLYVVGGPDENEVMLFSVVLALRDALSILLKNSTDKRTIIENYDLVSLAVDEIVDDGIILETDPVIVASRVSKAPTQEMPNLKNLDLSEQSVGNVWELAKMKLAERMRQGL